MLQISFCFFMFLTYVKDHPCCCMYIQFITFKYLLIAPLLILPVHLPCDGQLGTSNSSVLKQMLYSPSSFKSFYEPFVSCLGVYVHNGISESQGIHIYNATKYCQITFQNGPTSLHSHQHAERLPSLHIHNQCYQIFKLCQSDGVK